MCLKKLFKIDKIIIYSCFTFTHIFSLVPTHYFSSYQLPTSNGERLHVLPAGYEMPTFACCQSAARAAPRGSVTHREESVINPHPLMWDHRHRELASVSMKDRRGRIKVSLAPQQNCQSTSLVFQSRSAVVLSRFKLVVWKVLYRIQREWDDKATAVARFAYKSLITVDAKHKKVHYGLNILQIHLGEVSDSSVVKVKTTDWKVDQAATTSPLSKRALSKYISCINERYCILSLDTGKYCKYTAKKFCFAEYNVMKLLKWICLK